ncbi:unnamed protein product [Leuciscus chuanchicus]
MKKPRVSQHSIKTEFGTKESPYVLLLYFGYTVSSDVLALTTACKMDLYRFPFDTQICNITLQSTVYSDQEIKMDTLSNAIFDKNHIINKSKEIFQSQGEWDLIDITNSNQSTDDDLDLGKMHQLIYKITIKRRPLLYVINIIIPVFFFLVLDLISFFVDSSAAEKLSFKVTLLLSISVMLLLLNNTLPSTGTDIPLIGVFCGVTFCLIGISILETFFVNYLMAKGAEKRSVETTAAVSGQDYSVIDQQNPPDSVRDQNEERFCTPDKILTEVNSEKIPILAEQPVWSLGKLYTADLSDKHMANTVMPQLTEGLTRIDKSHLPGKFKIWSYQFTLYRRLMWPLKICEITTSTVQKMDSKANNYIRKWLGLPRSLSTVGLFGRNALQLPLRSILLGYRQEKARLVLELRNSSDPSVQNSKAPVRTGRKWRAELAVDQDISRLKHQEIVGRTQSGRTGLGWGTALKMWSKATRKERKELVISEVVRTEEENYQIQALSQHQQGR